MRRIALIDLADLEDPLLANLARASNAGRCLSQPSTPTASRRTPALGDRQALGPLRDAADDGDPEVRKAVRIALAQLQ